MLNSEKGGRGFCVFLIVWEDVRRIRKKKGGKILYWGGMRVQGIWMVVTRISVWNSSAHRGVATSTRRDTPRGSAQTTDFGQIDDPRERDIHLY